MNSKDLKIGALFSFKGKYDFGPDDDWGTTYVIDEERYFPCLKIGTEISFETQEFKFVICYSIHLKKIISILDSTPVEVF